MEYIYLTAFLLSLPIIWNVLLQLRFEKLFKSGKVWQIRAAYIIVTVILSHFVADAIYTFSTSIFGMFN